MTTETIEIKTFDRIDPALARADKCLTAIIKSGIQAYMSISNEPPEDLRTSKDNAQFHAIMTDFWKTGQRTLTNEYGDEITVKMRNYSFAVCKTFLCSWFVKSLATVEKVPGYMRPEIAIDPIYGDVYAVRASTKTYSVKQSRNFCLWLWSEGISEWNVIYTEPAHKEYEQYKEAQN